MTIMFTKSSKNVYILIETFEAEILKIKHSFKESVFFFIYRFQL